MFDCLLVPLDGSADAEAALAVAEIVPSKRVRLLTVASDSTELATLCLESSDCRAYLEQVAEPLRRQGRSVDTWVAFGLPAREIVASAAVVDLVVMGNHGRGAVGRAVLGSVADWVARHSPAPTLIVRGGRRPAATMPLTRIVVPLDGSPLAEQALPLAVRLAGDMGLPVHLVRVVDFEYLEAAIEAGVTAAEACAKLQGEIARDAKAKLDELVMELHNRNCVATSEVRIGDPAGELLAAGREGDLAVLVTHARGGFERWLLGSVAEALVQRAAGPVLLVRETAGARDRMAEEAGIVAGGLS
jgi:nucleotide-binding universal stress UspA family protein